MSYQIITFISIVQAVILFGHWVVYKTVTRLFNLEGAGLLLPFKITMAILSVSFLLASLFAFRFNNLFTRILYTISASWMGILWFLFLASILVSIILIFERILTGNFPVIQISRAVLALGLLIGIYGLIHASIFKVTEISVSLPNLPASWQGRRAVWISDIHLGQVRNISYSQRLADKVKSLNPDILFIGGDLYDGVAIDANKVITPIAAIKPAMGSYFISGNHEEFSTDGKFIKAVKNSGITVLDNRLVNIENLQIIGVDYHQSAGRENYKKILAGIGLNKSLPSILLKHAPFNLDVAEQAGISMEISGHTHRAQVFPLMYLTHKIYQGYDYGLKYFGKMLVFTSDGVGTWGPVSRVGTNSEIVVVTFKNLYEK